jgi:succinate dehydrogenase/fumarate reductase flavoprotein subunit
MSAGGICAVLVPDDTHESFYDDVMKGGGHLNNQKLVRILAEGSTNALFKLEDYGFCLDRKGLDAVMRGEGHSWPRGYLDRREGVGFCNGLSRALIRCGVDFRPEIVVFKLLLNNGRVVGALGYNLVTGHYLAFNAKAVILATGGLGALYKITTNSKPLTGDGYAMAFDAGAEMLDMEMMQFLPLAFPYPKSREGLNIGICSLFGPNVKLINGLGERYMEKYDPKRMEFSTRDTVSRANFSEIQDGRGTEKGAILVDTREHDPSILKRFQNFHPHIYRMFREIFGEPAANWQEPFEAIPSQHFFMGGIKIDENCATTVPGLYAVGEVTGGVHGANRLAGCALTEIFVFGDLVGRKTAQWIKKADLVPPIESEIKLAIEQLEQIFTARRKGIRPFELKQKIKNIMWDHFGPSREGDKMKKGLSKLRDIQETDLPHLALGSHQTVYNRDRVEAIELILMIKTAILVAHAALLRTESRGSHYRSDFPMSHDNQWLKNIVLQKGSEGEVRTTFREAQA